MQSTVFTDIQWDEKWDDEIGLWWQDGGHTAPIAHLPRVHAGTTAVKRLLLAAQTGQMEQIDSHKILTALSQMLCEEDGRLKGCFRWYWEEERPVDTNASFFTGLPLLFLRICHSDQLDDWSKAKIEDILRRLEVWFRCVVQERHPYYPNSFLGDLVCEWLLVETLGLRDTEYLESIMLETANYWLEQHWGWGEHLSDGYSGVCLNEFSALLLLSKRLPEQIRDKYFQLFSELLALEDRFDGKPRVPALRSYAFLTSPKHVNYRDRVRPHTEESARAAFHGGLSLEPTLYAQGWHQSAPPRAPKSESIEIPCFDGVTATARVEDDIRMGSVSRFPLMMSAEHPDWGLGWQCFPACFWRNEGDWAFLQWETREEDRTRCHPAEHMKTAYLGNALSLAVYPPVVGRTYAIQHAGNLVALRVMTTVPRTWERLTDRMRIVENRAQVSEARLDGCSQILFGYPERTVSIQCVPLTGASMPSLNEHDGVLDWELNYTREDLAPLRMIVTMWAISLNGKITEPPKLVQLPESHFVPRQKEERAWEVTWQWPDVNWHLNVDPLNPEPLREN